MMKMLVVVAVLLGVAAATQPRASHIPGGYIIGGNNVSPVGKWPWQASLQRGTSHICGASLISTRWLVTAAHCVGSSPSYYSIVLGMHDRVGQRYGQPTRYSVSRITRHPYYSSSGSRGYPNDIAVMYLSSSANTGSQYISTVPMASSSDSFVGSTCYITGWGKTSSSSGSPDILQEAKVDVYTQSYCRSKWGNSISGYHICVGSYGKRGSCSGDSGGPLVCSKGGRWTLAGATSWGEARCSTTMPSVYASIPYFRSWIQQQTGV